MALYCERGPRGGHAPPARGDPERARWRHGRPEPPVGQGELAELVAQVRELRAELSEAEERLRAVLARIEVRLAAEEGKSDDTSV
jgi:hypothetical protein